MREATAYHRPRQATVILVDVDDQLAGDEAVAERDDAGIAVHLRIHHEARRQAPMDGADIADCVPYLLGARFDDCLLADRGHVSSPLPSQLFSPQ